jgi:hypothetical protein
VDDTLLVQVLNSKGHLLCQPARVSLCKISLEGGSGGWGGGERGEHTRDVDLQLKPKAGNC